MTADTCIFSISDSLLTNTPLCVTLWSVCKPGFRARPSVKAAEGTWGADNRRHTQEQKGRLVLLPSRD